MDPAPESTEERITRLHGQGIVDLHFDLPMFLYDNRDRKNVLASDFLPEFEAGDIGTAAASIYIEDQYIPDNALGVRVIGRTHARSNATGSGGVFAPTGSSPKGLTAFGCELVRECERVGVILDLAHINPAGFDNILENTTRPVIVSHTNARKYYDVERNISDEQIKMVGARGGVIGINSVLVSPKKEDSTLDRYVDQVAYVIDLVGIDGVGIGFDFFEFIYRRWSEDERVKFHQKFPNVHFIP